MLLKVDNTSSIISTRNTLHFGFYFKLKNLTITLKKQLIIKNVLF